MFTVPAILTFRFTADFDRGLPIIRKGIQIAIHFSESFPFSFGIVPEIPNHFSYPIPILLFYKTIIILAVGPAAGKLDLFLLTPQQHLRIDEFTSVV